MGMGRRVSALERYINQRVEERLEQEIEVVLTRLEEGLSREEFVRVLKIISQEEEHGA